MPTAFQVYRAKLTAYGVYNALMTDSFNPSRKVQHSEGEKKSSSMSSSFTKEGKRVSSKATH